MADNESTYILRIRAQMDKTLRDALSEVANVGRQLSKEAKQIQKDLKSVGEDGINVDKVQSDVRQLTQEIRKLRTPVKETDQISAEASKSMDRWQRNIQRLEQELVDLPQKIQLVNNKLDGLRARGDTSSATFQAYSSELARLNQVQKQFATGTTATGNSMRNLRFQAQNAAYQITDFGVSMQNGTRASVAFTQQMPQLLAGFGGIGVALSLVATAVGIFAASWIDNLAEALSPTKAFTEANKEMEKSIQKFTETVNNVSLDNYIKQLERADDAQAGLLGAVTEFQLGRIEAANKKAIGALSKSIKEGISDSVNEAYGSVFRLNRLFRETSFNTEIQLGLGLASDRARALEKALKGINEKTNFEKVVQGLDPANEKQQQLVDLIFEYINALEQAEVIEKRQTEQQSIRQARETGQYELLAKLGHDRALLAIEELKINDSIQEGFAERVRQAYAVGDITQKQLDALLRTKKTTDEITKANEKLVADYKKLAESVDTSSEARDRELKKLQEMETSLKRLAENNPEIKIDPEVFARARAEIEKTFKKKELEEYLASLSKVDRMFYDMKERAKETAEALARLETLDPNSEEYEKLAESLGKAAPIAVQLDQALSKMLENEEYIAAVNAEIAKMAEELALSEDQVEKLQKAMGTFSKNSQKELTDFEKKLQSVEDNGISRITDAFVDMAKTGKLSFGDLVESILTDLAKLYLNEVFKAIFKDAFNVGSGATPGFFSAAPARSAAPIAQSRQPTYIPLTAASGAPVSGFNSSDALASNTTVNIINNSGAQASVTETRGSGGRTVNVMIENAMENAIAQGRLDKALGGTYGLRRRGA